MRAYRIDTHVHVIPPAYKAAIEAHGDPSGWALPAWSLEAAVEAADTLAVRVAVLSVTSPGPAIAGRGAEGRRLARACNDEVNALVRQYPRRFAFFASLPDWNDVQGTLEEIEYALGTLGCPGVVCMTSYGDRLLGDPKFKPIWGKLNAYETVVFVHPAAVNIQPKLVAGALPQPIVDYPQQTTRCAADLVLTRTVTSSSRCKVILSHAGGTLPYLADRIGMGSRSMAVSGYKNPPTSREVAEAFRSLYYDVALSTHPTALYGLLQITDPDHVLFGSDFPYAPLAEGGRQTRRLDALVPTAFPLLSGLNSHNADKLFGGMDKMFDKMRIPPKSRI